MLLRPKSKHARRGPLARFFALFNAGFARAQSGYVSVCGLLIRKLALAFAVLAGFMLLAVAIGKAVPQSFLPDEDQGYFLVNVELPEAASLQRTVLVMRKIEAILKTEPALRYASGIGGFSILSQTTGSRNAVYFCQLKPFNQRMSPALQSAPVVASVNQKLAAMLDARAFAFLPPAIPGIGQAGGVDFFIQDHAGKSVDYLWGNTQKFLDAARKRPELARMNLTFSPRCRNCSRTLITTRCSSSAFRSATFTARCRLCWAVTTSTSSIATAACGRSSSRRSRSTEHTKKDVGQFYVRNKQGEMIPLSTLVSMQPAFGPEYTTRFNEYRGIEIFALPAPGYSTGDAMKAVTEVAGDGPAPRYGIRLERNFLPAVGSGRRCGGLRAVADPGLPDPGRAV